MFAFIKWCAKALLFTVLLLLALLVTTALVLRLGWPLWTSLAIIGGGIAFFYAVRFIRRSLRQRAEEKNVAKMLAADAEAGGAKEPVSAGAKAEMAARQRLEWKRGLARLRAAPLERGLPKADALPWFLAFGSATSKKTEVLNGMRVRVGMAGAKDAEEGDPAFRWHFTSQAVWLDISPRLLHGGEEWRLFLRELTRQQGGRRMGGAAIFLDAPELLAGNADAIREEAVLFRSRLDETMRAIGAGLQSYVLVNDVDGLYGMSALTGAMSAEALAAPMGAFNNAPDSEKPEEFVGRTMRELVDRLRLAALTNPRGIDGRERAAAFQVPSEIDRLKDPLVAVLREIFKENPYQIRLNLRGLFLGGIGRADAAMPSAQAELSSFAPPPLPTKCERTLFWTDLFEKWLPTDPAPVRPLRERRHFRAFVNHAGLSVFLLGTLAINLLNAMSFAEARRVWVIAGGEAQRPNFQAPLRSVITAMMNKALRLEEANAAWQLPRMGMNEPLLLERAAKREFCDFMNAEILPQSINDMKTAVDEAIESRNPESIGGTLLQLNFLQRFISERLGGRKEGISDFINSLARKNAFFDPEEQKESNYYFSWVEDLGPLNKTLRYIDDLEVHLINTAMGGDLLAWIPAWINRFPEMSPIRLSEAWQPIVIPAAEAERGNIPASWTAAGYQRAKDIVKTICFDRNRNEIKAKEEEFLEQYRQEALRQWLIAIGDGYTPAQLGPLVPDSVVEELIANFGFNQSPEKQLMNIMSAHLVPIFKGVPQPVQIRSLLMHIELDENASVLISLSPGKAESGVSKRVMEIIAPLGAALSSTQKSNLPMVSGKDDYQVGLFAYRKVIGAFQEIASRAMSIEECFQIVRAEYAGTSLPPPPAGGAAAENKDAASTANPFKEVEKGIADIRRYFTAREDVHVWDLLDFSNSYEWLRYLLVRRAAQQAEKMWQSGPYTAARLLPGTPTSNVEQLFASGGIVSNFMLNDMKGLWEHGESGFENAEWQNLPFRFNKNFLDYLAWGSALAGIKTPEKFAFTMAVDSVSVDAGARERPMRVEFLWDTTEAQQRLNYQNYPISRQFEWKPRQEMVIVMRISFPSLQLEKTWSGPKAAFDFITTFRRGAFTWKPQDFPGAEETLARLGVSEIRMRVGMRHQEEAVRFYSQREMPLPYTIVMEKQADGERKANSRTPSAPVGVSR